MVSCAEPLCQKLPLLQIHTSSRILNMKDRFKFPDGGEMNGYWMYKTLSNNEKRISHQLVVKGGFLGCNENDIKEIGLGSGDIESLVKGGMLRETTLMQLSEELLGDEENQIRRRDLEEQGGFLVLDDEEERTFFRNFDIALDVVEGNDFWNGEERRYQIAHRKLYDFLEILF